MFYYLDYLRELSRKLGVSQIGRDAHSKNYQEIVTRTSGLEMGRRDCCNPSPISYPETGAHQGTAGCTESLVTAGGAGKTRVSQLSLPTTATLKGRGATAHPQGQSLPSPLLLTCDMTVCRPKYDLSQAWQREAFPGICQSSRIWEGNGSGGRGRGRARHQPCLAVT